MGAFVNPQVAAQSGQVTLYGIIDLGIEYGRIRQAASAPSSQSGAINESYLGMANGVQSGSRWGLKGVEALGGGLSADFVLEGGFNSATGTSAQSGRLFGRQSTLGLSQREVGRIDVGRRINLASDYFLDIDPFSEGFGQANIGASFGSANTTRYGNMVLVQATPLTGLTLGAGYSFATQLTAIYANEGNCIETQSCPVQAGAYNFSSAQNMRALTLGARYKHGPLQLALAYDKLAGDVTQTQGAAQPSEWMVGGAYDFNVVRVSAAVGRNSNGFFNGQAAGTGSVTPTAGLVATTWNTGSVLFLPGVSSSSYMLGINAPLSSQMNLLSSVQLMRPEGIIANNTSFKLQQIYSAALTQQISPRTNLYVYTSLARNFAVVNSAESFMFGVGMRHKF